MSESFTSIVESVLDGLIPEPQEADAAAPARDAGNDAETPKANEGAAPPQNDDEEQRLNQSEREMLARFEQTLSPEELEAFRKTFVGKSAFTKLRAKDREQVRAIEQEREQLRQQNAWAIETLQLIAQMSPQWGAQNAAPQQPAMPPQGGPTQRIDEFIRSKNLDETNPDIAAFFREFGMVLQREAEERAQQAVLPFTQQQMHEQHQRAKEQYRAVMVEKYGPEFDHYWPDLYEQTARSGFQVDPEMLFLRNYEEDALRLRLAQRTRENSNKAGAAANTALEGFASTRGVRPTAPRFKVEPKDDRQLHPTRIAMEVLSGLDAQKR